VKILALTPEGEAAKEALMAQLARRMPWCYALDEAERRCFRDLLRKMLDAPDPNAGPAASGEAGTGEGTRA
jgi:hypothetical protein